MAPKGLFRGGRPGVCRVCQRPTGKRSQWHPACLDLFRALRNPAELRRLVLLRDNGVCSACGLDCHSLEGVIRHWRRHKSRKVRRLVARFYKESGVHDGRVSFWDADHVKRVADGGGLSALRNVRTLCVWCHVRRASPERDTGKAVVDRVYHPLAVEADHVLHDLANPKRTK